LGRALGDASLGKTAFSLRHRLQAPRVRQMMLHAGVAAPIADRVIARINDLVRSKLVSRRIVATDVDLRRESRQTDTRAPLPATLYSFDTNSKPFL
jgi:hypothetical protein